MSSEKDSGNSDSERNTTKKEGKTKKKYKDSERRKFVESWLLFPQFKGWLTRDKSDPLKPYCKACKNRLIPRKCKLERHGETSKHRRNMYTYLNGGVQPSTVHLGQRRERKRPKKFDDSSFQSDIIEEDHNYYSDDNAGYTQEEIKIDRKSPEPRSPKNKKRRDPSPLKVDLKIEPKEQTPIKKDDSDVEAFFKSIFTTVSALPPPMIVEAKMRLMQLICELEVRALLEKEGNAQAASASSTAFLPDSVTANYVKKQQSQENEDNPVVSSQSDVRLLMQ